MHYIPLTPPELRVDPDDLAYLLSKGSGGTNKLFAYESQRAVLLWVPDVRSSLNPAGGGRHDFIVARKYFKLPRRAISHGRTIMAT